VSQPLTPAAQAVLDAVRAVSPAPADEIAAVALRALARLGAFFPMKWKPSPLSWGVGDD